MKAVLAILLALAPLAAAPATASDMSDGECVHWARYACATIHFDKAGLPSCTVKPREPMRSDECSNARFVFSDLREYDEGPDGLDAYASWRYASKPVPDKLLADMTPEMLRVFRNTFFAGHGRVFKDRTLDAYFRGFPWYKPRADFADSDLSEVERANAEKAAREAERRKKPRSGAPPKSP